MAEPSGSATPTAAEWAAVRGEKWRAQLAGLEATLAPVDAPLADALQLAGPCRIAEIGCGGGGTALALARRAPPGSVVHGYDISPVLIEAARARVPAGGAPALAFEIADVATATPPAPYDRLASRFGVMFFDDAPAAFANLHDWLAPGGRFAFAVWADLDANPWMSATRDAMAEVVAVPPSDPDAPNAFRYARAGKLVDLLERAGFAGIAVHEWRGALALGGGLDAAEAARFALAAFSIAEWVAGVDAETRERAHRALTAAYARYLDGGVVRVGAGVHLVTGARGTRDR